MWPFHRTIDPKSVVLATLVRAKFASLGRAERIAFTNLRTTDVSDLAIVCELDLIAHQILDLADRWKRNGKAYDAWFGRRRVTIAHFGGGCEWECGITGLVSGGAKRLIHAGVCGALRDDIALGDLVVATSVVVNDDLARSYTEDSVLECAGPMLDFVRQQCRELADHAPVHFVRAVSAPTFFNQTRDRLERWAELGQIVDMEVASIAALAKHHGCEWLSVFTVAYRKLQGEDLFTMSGYPMAKLFDHGRLMLGAIAKGIRLFNQPRR